MTATPAPAPRRRRGRENAMDMVRSLGIVLLIAAGLLYLHRPPPSDARRIRVVDPAGDIAVFRSAAASAAATALVPGPLPAGWRPTSSTYKVTPTGLRIGYVTPLNQYAEYDAQVDPPGSFVADITARAPAVGTVTVAGRSWRETRGSDGALSLVTHVPGVTVVVGSFRDSATIGELTVLVESLVPPA